MKGLNDMWKCPACKYGTDDNDKYLSHLVEHKRVILHSITSAIDSSIPKTITTGSWTEANEEQAEGRFNRKSKQ